jgi:seryl-tRNA synthetase
MRSVALSLESHINKVYPNSVMLDIQLIRQNPEAVKKGMLAKGEADTSAVDRVLELDQQWRSMLTELEQLRSESNARAKTVGTLKAQGKLDEAQKVISETGQAKERIKQMEADVASLEAERYKLLLRIPNLPHPSVPLGKSDADNVVLATWGPLLPKGNRVPHWEILEHKGWVDFVRGSKVAGAGFPFYVGKVARLQRALINFFINEAVKKGYIEIQPPFFVNEDSARGTGQIPDKEDMMYTVPRDGFFAIPTAEVPVTNFYRDEIIPESELPLKMVAYTPCWRREAGSYGKDVRGLNRLHQFDKVELVKFVTPETSYDELESLREDAEQLLQKLGLSYRVLLMCTGDMGFTQTKKYDLEVWSAGQQRWLEVSSCSNFESFQARRMMIRCKGTDGNVRILHTLNGSGLALPRVVAALIEQYQTPDGDFEVPEVLQPWF